jgi:hypothetical protein
LRVFSYEIYSICRGSEKNFSQAVLLHLRVRTFDLLLPASKADKLTAKKTIITHTTTICTRPCADSARLLPSVNSDNRTLITGWYQVPLSLQSIVLSQQRSCVENIY